MYIVMIDLVQKSAMIQPSFLNDRIESLFVSFLMIQSATFFKNANPASLYVEMFCFTSWQAECWGQ